MSISLRSGFNKLAIDEPKVHAHLKTTQHLYEHQKLIQKLETQLRSEFSEQVTTFNWENDPEKRALLDQIYDQNLVEGCTERKYAFTETNQVLLFMQRIKAALEGKSAEVQESHQLYNHEKEELTQFYQNLIDIIARLSQLVSFLSSRV